MEASHSSGTLTLGTGQLRELELEMLGHVKKLVYGGIPLAPSGLASEAPRTSRSNNQVLLLMVWANDTRIHVVLA